MLPKLSLFNLKRISQTVTLLQPPSGKIVVQKIVGYSDKGVPVLEKLDSSTNCVSKGSSANRVGASLDVGLHT